MIDQLKRTADRILDRAASAVQGFTGESERRELVMSFKEVYASYSEKISRIVERINDEINQFNNRIEKLNKYRNTTVKKNLAFLGGGLSQLGNIKAVERFAPEARIDPVHMPSKHLETVESYIETIDWSKDDIFSKTFFKGIIGVRRETKKVNVEAVQRIEEFKTNGNRTLELGNLKFRFVQEDIHILEIYQESVEMIADTIETKVLPELQLIHAFLQCEEIKNQVLSNRELSVSAEMDAGVLVSGRYKNHYRFVKNAFLFFVVSSKIYDSPVLTKLLTNESHDVEREAVSDYGRIITEQTIQLEKYRID
ncbi:hypothetical protein [Paenibacillus piscarius]|uniref:hypothetical protein n=1 Tax=Paenibacillus piscarius TaxID=1089681 RepID=UPI001EE99EC2|nr:hypothetical protein [Paenibacillus piscarius]